MKYFTSDWHLGHEGSITFMKRPFANLEEMEDYFVKTMWGLPKGSELYHLGDCAWNTKALEHFLKRKPAWIGLHLIYGNHDNRVNFNILKRYINSLDDIKTIKIDDQKIVLCHYPMAVWNCSCYNSWQLHGHIHKISPPYKSIGKQLNVNVEFTDYKPVSYDEVVELMKDKEEHPEYIEIKKRFVRETGIDIY